MKETVNVNIASQAFTMDDDAYHTLRTYLDEIRRRLPPDDHDTMEDVEGRLAELFRERLSSPMLVVTLPIVRQAMEQMGRPDAFGTPASEEPPTQLPAVRRRLYRSRSNRSIAGICGGLAAFFDLDPTAVRLVTLLLILFGGLSIWAYIILWIVIPEEPLTFNIHR